MSAESFDLDALLLAIRAGICEQCRELSEKGPGFVARNNAAAKVVGDAEKAIAAEVARLTVALQAATARDAAFLQLLDATQGAVGFADQAGGSYLMREHDFERLDDAYQRAEAFRPARLPTEDTKR